MFTSATPNGQFKQKWPMGTFRAQLNVTAGETNAMNGDVIAFKRHSYLE